MLSVWSSDAPAGAAGARRTNRPMTSGHSVIMRARYHTSEDDRAHHPVGLGAGIREGEEIEEGRVLRPSQAQRLADGPAERGAGDDVARPVPLLDDACGADGGGQRVRDHPDAGTVAVGDVTEPIVAVVAGRVPAVTIGQREQPDARADARGDRDALQGRPERRRDEVENVVAEDL